MKSLLRSIDLRKWTWPTLGIAITLLLALIGELFRFKGILLLDIWVPLFVGAWLIGQLTKKSLSVPVLSIPAFLFVALGTVSLLINSANMDNGAFLGALLYGVRWCAMFLLIWVVANESKESKQVIFHLLIAFAVLLSLAGFIQLQVYPDFTDLEILGWDPHQGRLLSTWFDPNFVGGLLAFLLPLCLVQALEKPNAWLRWIAPAIVLIALTLTLSRSAYLALALGVFVLGALRSWRLLIALAALALLGYMLVPSLNARVNDLAGSATSFFSETYALPDASARLRLGSWEEAWELFLDKPLLGHGYNRYEVAALSGDLLKDTNIHSASGSDSSLLTILATVGVLGFIPYLLTYFMLLENAWHSRKTVLGLGFLAGLAGLFIHSVFVNSLLFTLMLAPFWITAGLIPRLDSIKFNLTK